MSDAAAVELVPAPHAREIQTVVDALDADISVGLSAAEVHRRHVAFGPNQLRVVSSTSRLRLLFRQFNNSLVLVLLVAAVVSGAILQEWVDTTVILAIVILNAGLGYSQEHKAEHALLALEAMSAPDAVVRRDGVDRRVDSREIVPGDLVVLEAGDRVAADARVLESIHLQTNEAALTGESIPASKQCDPVAEHLSTADQDNMTFAGTTVSAGRGLAVVTSIGGHTEFGKVAELLEVEQPRTPLTVELDRVGKQIAVAALIIALGIFGLGVARQISAETMFLTAVALAVAAIPEGLSALVTVTLSRGVSKMAEHNAIIRHLPAVEALGATTVICTDKTGTLTRNEIRVQELEFADLHATDVGGVSDPRVHRYTLIAALCNDARPSTSSTSNRSFIGDPTEVALLLSVDPVLVSVNELRASYVRIDEAAFDSTRKLMSTLNRAPDGKLVLLVKGAPESIIERSTSFDDRSGQHPLTAERAAAAAEDARRLAARGLRTLALAYRRIDTQPSDLAEAEDGLTLVAIVGMSDEVRPEAADAVHLAQRAGIAVVMITGDHLVTAEAVGTKLGIHRDDDRILGGDELRAMSATELCEQIDDYRIFARVDPADKVGIVHAWQSTGAIVAMTGDGVNDAPALRSADIGISMGTGTAVAREASAMVLADDNFSTIVSAVERGRAIYANLTKIVYFLLSANISEVLVMVIGFITFGSLGEPLLATQLLWINLVTDGLPAVALGTDQAGTNLMDRPPLRDHRILTRARQIRLLWQGGILAVAALGAFAWGYTVRGLPFDESRTLLFTALVLVQLVHMYNIRVEDQPGWALTLRGNRALAFTAALSILLQLLVVYTPQGNELFSATPIALIDLVIIVLFSLAAMVIVRLLVLRQSDGTFDPAGSGL